ncbi:hypothetical protein [Sphingomonas sp. VNH70]|uniref:hypothetical protein n=1 Tax=Sphingomonas silueang TaxID=3156617 RepID=UPI0032B49517
MNDFWTDETNRIDPPRPVRPPKRRQVRKRWIAAALIGLFVLLLVIVPKPTPEQIAARKAEEEAAERKSTADKARATATAKAALTNETKALWGEIVAASEACEEWGTVIGDAAKAGNTYALYDAATKGATACRNGYRRVDDLKPPPSSTGDIEDAFEKGIDTCGSALIARQIAYEKTAAVADGNMRPSAVAEVTEAMKRAGGGGLACAGTFVEAAAKAGVDTSVFKAAT